MKTIKGRPFRIAYVPWWRPIRLARHKPEGGIEFVGWVWRDTVRQVQNLHHGRIAFIEDQTPEKLSTCPMCDRPTHDDPRILTSTRRSG